MKVLFRLFSIVAIILLTMLTSAQAQEIKSYTPPLMSDPFPIFVTDYNKYAPQVAYNSQHNEYLVIWENIQAGDHHDIYGQRVSASGQLLSWFAISAGSNNRVDPALAYDHIHDRYLVVWSYDFYGDGSDQDIRGRFVSWDGSSLGDEFIISDSTVSEYHPKVAYGQSINAFTVVWMSVDTDIPEYISARQVWAENGTFPGPTWIVSQGADDRDFPDIAYNLTRNEWLIVWTQWVLTDWDIYGVRLTGGGIPLGSGNFAIYATSAEEMRPSVAACRLNDQYLVVLEKDAGGATGFDIWMRYLDGDGLPGAIFEVSANPVPEKFPDVACSYSGYLLAWQVLYSGSLFGINARDAGDDGFTRDPVAVWGPQTGQNRTRPAIGAGKTQFLIAWEHQASHSGPIYQDIYGRIYTPYAVFLPFLKN
jgi:hypothetical protein